jgi:hypothetical protein
VHTVTEADVNRVLEDAQRRKLLKYVTIHLTDGSMAGAQRAMHEIQEASDLTEASYYMPNMHDSCISLSNQAATGTYAQGKKQKDASAP